VLACAADGDVCDAHVSCMAVFGQDSRIRHLGEGKIPWMAAVILDVILGWAT
jgi:hypothetical protein